VEWVENDVYARSILCGKTPGVIEVSCRPRVRVIVVRLPADFRPCAIQIVDGVRRMFDLDADPEAINTHLKRDERLAPLIEANPGRRVPGAWCGFELAVRAILGQQISVSAATALSGKLVAAFGTRIETKRPELTASFPTPRQLATAPIASIGMPSARANAITQLARALLERKIALEPGPVQVNDLLALPGIGEWTAQYIAMRALREPDAFPAADVVLRRKAGYLDHTTYRAPQLEQRSVAWRPWRAYAAMHIWALDPNNTTDGEKA